eukprot:scaffold6173_cov46-Prasinocladus_malaysianus.AAC.7
MAVDIMSISAHTKNAAPAILSSSDSALSNTAQTSSSLCVGIWGPSDYQRQHMYMYVNDILFKMLGNA